MSEIKAVLVRLTIRIFPNTKQDAEITNEVRQQKNLGFGAGKWVKTLLPQSAFAAIREIGGQFRRRHYDITLPWEDGYRLLPAGAHELYENEFTAHRALFEASKVEFGNRYERAFKLESTDQAAWEYNAILDSLKLPMVKPTGKDGMIELPSLLDQAKLMHNGTFDDSLYPEWRFLQNQFHFTMEFTPVPKASHFITGGIAADAIAEMKSDLEARNTERVQAAVKDTWTRLMTPVQAIAEKLASKESIFRNSLIANVQDIVGLIPALNLTNDQELRSMAREIGEKFSNLDPEELRENEQVRKEASQAAQSIIKRFGAVGKRRFA